MAKIFAIKKLDKIENLSNKKINYIFSMKEENHQIYSASVKSN